MPFVVRPAPTVGWGPLLGSPRLHRARTRCANAERRIERADRPMGEAVGEIRYPALTGQPTGRPDRLHFDTVFAVTLAAAKRGIPLTLPLPAVDGLVRRSKEAGPGEPLPEGDVGGA